MKVKGLGMKIWEICILRAEILAENKAENTMFFFSKYLKWGSGHMSNILMVIGRLGNADWSEKRGL